MNIPDMYSTIHKSFIPGLREYSVPKTTLYLDKSMTIPKAEKPTAFKQKALEISTVLEDHWVLNSGKFSTIPRKTFVEEQIEKQRSSPGPGYYHSEPKKVQKPSKMKARSNFIDGIEHAARQTPVPWKYTPSYSLVHASSPQWKFKEPRVVKEPPKARVGPGCYNNDHYERKRAKSVSAIILKAKQQNHIFKNAIDTADLPPIGSYNANYTNKKSLSGKFHLYRIRRFPSDAVKVKENVPGPGSYNIGPPKNHI